LPAGSSPSLLPCGRAWAPPPRASPLTSRSRSQSKSRSATVGGTVYDAIWYLTLQSGQGAFVGLQLARQSSHVDFEGEDTDALASAVCGRPRADTVEAACMLAADRGALTAMKHAYRSPARRSGRS
jgi:hypothetical protein